MYHLMTDIFYLSSKSLGRVSTFFNYSGQFEVGDTNVNNYLHTHDCIREVILSSFTNSNKKHLIIDLHNNIFVLDLAQLVMIKSCYDEVDHRLSDRPRSHCIINSSIQRQRPTK